MVASPAPCGRLAQLVRALARHARGQWFESTTAHHPCLTGRSCLGGVLVLPGEFSCRRLLRKTLNHACPDGIGCGGDYRCRCPYQAARRGDRSLPLRHIPSEIHAMVAASTAPPAHCSPARPTSRASTRNSPTDLFTLGDASRKYGCPINRLRNWVYRGHLSEMGRIKGLARGGRAIP